ncbi:MAG TPA: hypothetical protein VFH88_02595 [Candidatus Krumholzibacteria bacterium]|nr:hypothetical protein [Candidatus Krumholzibacteria bacterium]
MDPFTGSFVIYIVVVCALLGPVAWKWREQAAWNVFEVIGVFGAYIAWILLIFHGPRGATLNSFVIEPIVLGASVAIVGSVRAGVARAIGADRAAGLSMAALLACAFLVRWLTPILPE